MKNTAQRASNRTGISVAPEMAQKMIAATIEFAPVPVDKSIGLATLRGQYNEESGPLGSLPEMDDKIRGHLLDKLSERLAFERGGVRLYEAFLAKCAALAPQYSAELLRQFHREEAQHLRWVIQCIENLGGDPTCQTPCADVTGITTMGLVQVVTDPRTDLIQATHALLLAEIADNVGWDLLIQLLEKHGFTEDVERFQTAKAQEDNHLIHMRQWYDEMVLKGGPLELH